MTFPTDALQAARHPDPYPWYRQLAQGAPLAFEPGLQLWIAAGPRAVEAALRHPQLRVRPPAEPVPRALLGTAAGEVFAQLVRMNDGEFHARHRPEVAQSAARWSGEAVQAAARTAATRLASRLDANAWLSAVPVEAMARLLGVAEEALDDTIHWVHAFTLAIAPGADAHAIRAGDLAARHLMEQGAAGGLPPPRAANRIALMQQALDATAGLIGNGALALRRLGDAPRDVQQVVADTAVHDPAVHNTRRFAAASLQLAGQAIAPGQCVLVLLASAPGFGFGAGPHQCPGERLAVLVATAALASFADAATRDRFLGAHVGYRPLPNARVPVFAS